MTFTPPGTVRSRSRIRVMATVAALVLAVVLALTIFALVYQSTNRHRTGLTAYGKAGESVSGPLCVTKAPAGSAAPVVAFVKALNRAAASRKAITDNMQAHDGLVNQVDMVAQMQSDRRLIQDIDAISFPAEQADAVTGYVHAVQRYDAPLVSGSQIFGYLARPDISAEVNQLGAARGAAGDTAWFALGLAPSTCHYTEP